MGKKRQQVEGGKSSQELAKKCEKDEEEKPGPRWGKVITICGEDESAGRE